MKIKIFLRVLTKFLLFCSSVLISVDKQVFGMATELADFFSNVNFDGILGLAWPALATDGAVPFMFNAKELLDIPVFSVYMTTYDCYRHIARNSFDGVCNVLHFELFVCVLKARHVVCVFKMALCVKNQAAEGAYTRACVRACVRSIISRTRVNFCSSTHSDKTVLRDIRVCSSSLGKVSFNANSI